MTTRRHNREEGRVLAGRYRLAERVGQGTSGTVHRARDLVTGGDVAIKLLLPMSAIELVRVRREIAALRALRLPGVARLLDHGEDEGEHFLVMDFVEGTRFPGEGATRDWGSIGPRAVALLETLANVHAAGVVHRDLKPANVLVDKEGRPTVLDFGLARGPAMAGTVTGQDVLIGTPRYLAPEQVLGQLVDARSDLYAVGTMLYEALAGRLPHDDRDVRALLFLRTAMDPIPVESCVPGLPPGAARMIDRLVARRAEDRPRGALEALADIAGDPIAGGERPLLPRLGGEGPVVSLVSAGREGRSLDVWGPPGSGRTRCLREAAAVLEAEGRGVVPILAGARPYQSLRAALGVGDAPDVGAALAEIVRMRLVGGAVFVVDDAARIDPWSLRLLEEHRAVGAVLRVCDAPGALRMPLLSEADLVPLFAGPERLLHLPSDAARALHERAGGLPGRVDAEVRAWVAAGLARWEGEKLAIDRPALERLAGGLRLEAIFDDPPEAAPSLMPALEELLAWVSLAWPHARSEVLAAAMGSPRWEVDLMLADLSRAGLLRAVPGGGWRSTGGARGLRAWSEERRIAASSALADALTPGTPGRLPLLLAAERFGDAAEEARIEATALAADGRVARAAGVLGVGLMLARQAGVAEGSLLTELVRAALSAPTQSALEEARYELARAVPGEPLVEQLSALVEGALSVRRGDGDASLAPVESLGTLADEGLECLRQGLRVEAAFLRGVESGRALLLGLEAWSRGSALRNTRYAGWLGLLRYREGAFDEAASLHRRRAAGETTPAARLSASLNAASALLDAFRPREAREEAARARDLARERRLVRLEARAEWMIRAGSYRLGEASLPDHELVAVMPQVGDPRTLPLVYLTEAAFAWRSGEHAVGARLADRASQAFTALQHDPPAALARALAAACRRQPDPGLVAVANRVGGRLGLQTLALLAAAGTREARAHGTVTIDSVPTVAEGLRMEVLAPREALAYLRAPS